VTNFAVTFISINWRIAEQLNIEEGLEVRKTR